MTRGEGFALFVAVCNSPARINRLIARLGEEAGVAPVTATLRRVDVEPSRQIVEQLPADDDGRAPLMVRLDDPLFRDRDAGERLLQLLNLERPFWPERFGRPVVWWVPEFAARLLLRGAPDFFSWRSGFYIFADKMLSSAKASVHRSGSEREGWLTATLRTDRLAELQKRLDEQTFSNDPTRLVIAAEWWREAGHHRVFLGDELGAEAAFNRYKDLSIRSGDYEIISNALILLGTLAESRNNVNAAEHLYQEALALTRKHGGSETQIFLLNCLGDVARGRGDMDLAGSLYGESLVICREGGHSEEEARTLRGIGTVAFDSGDLDAAESRHREALAISRKGQDREEQSFHLMDLSRVARARNDLDGAGKLCEEALTLRRAAGNIQDVAFVQIELGIIAGNRGDTDAAMHQYAEALVNFRECGYLRGQAIALTGLSITNFEQQNFDAVRQSLTESRDLYARMGRQTDVAWCDEWLVKLPQLEQGAG